MSLLEDIEKIKEGDIEVILTLNIDEILPFDPGRLDFPIRLLRNSTPKGFGANHNAAFTASCGHYFCVVNPDIRFSSNPLPMLIDCLNNGRIGVAAPRVRNTAGEVEDNARRFPSPLSIAAKIFSRTRDPDYLSGGSDISPDWVAGMFMLIPFQVFREIGGFDERYFLYYEDVDLCARLRRSGYDIRLCSGVQVVHDARRQSHRDWKYRRWHIVSVLRFFTSPVYFSFLWSRWMKKMAASPGSIRR